MAAPANTGVTTNYSTLREDLSNVVVKISPTETPIWQVVKHSYTFAQPYHEWSQVALAAANEDNAVIEGADATNNAVDTPTRLGNYAQLMEKTAQISSIAEKSKAAGNIMKMAVQIGFKMAEIKLDMEKRLLTNKPAVPGDQSTAGKTAGIPAFIRTNVSRGVGGANSTLSGTTTGYPNAIKTDGTARVFTEDLVKTVLQSAWTNGGNPSLLVVGGFNKTQFSNFVGNATRFKDADDKRLVAAIAVYESDFGKLSAVPSRQTDPTQALLLDTGRCGMGYLVPMRQAPLAKTGHSERRMIEVAWGVVVDNERALGVVADLTTA